MTQGLGKIRKFGKLSGAEQLLFAEAFFLQLSIGLLLKIIPFRRIPGLFSNPQFEAPTQVEAQSRHVVSGPQSSVNSPQSVVIIMIKAAIVRAGRASPWKNRCLVSSLAGRCMLRRRKIESQISLGVDKDENGRLIAHAWLGAGGIEIVPRDGNFQEMYLF